MTFQDFLTQKYPLYSDPEMKVNLTVQQVCELVEEWEKTDEEDFRELPVSTVIKTDTIKCPECSKIQDAEVTQGNAPFATYIKVCECGYIIMESEWNLTNKHNEK